MTIEVATVLYKAEAPLLIYDAEKLLRILLEADYVRLVPDSYHNYMSYQEEGSVYELPWEYEYSDDGDSSQTWEQHQEIVSLTEWQPEEQVNLSLSGFVVIVSLAYLYTGAYRRKLSFMFVLIGLI